MTRVVIVGEIYNADLSIGGGPVYPPAQPTHPWVPPGGGQPPYPDQGLPPFPSHPWVPPTGGQPPQPGVPTHPIYNPAYPSHPIYNPAYPDQGLPQPPQAGGVPSHPIYFPPEPTHPIVLPPGLPPTLPDPDNRPIEWKTGWTAETGWVVVGIPQVPVPTPSAG